MKSLMTRTSDLLLRMNSEQCPYTDLGHPIQQVMTEKENDAKRYSEAEMLEDTETNMLMNGRVDTHTEKYRLTHRQTNTETHTQTDRQIHRTQTDKQISYGILFSSPFILFSIFFIFIFSFSGI